MKAGYTISVLAHGLGLAAALFWFLWASPAPLEAPPADPIVADVVTDTEFSQITAGVTTAKQTPVPKPVVDKVADVADPAPKAPELKVAKQEVVTTTAPPPAPPQPDPKPDPTPEAKPEQKTDPKPAPAKPEAQTPPPAATPPAPEPPDPMVEALEREQARKEEARKAEEKKAEEARKIAEKKAADAKKAAEKKAAEMRRAAEAKKVEEEHKQDLSRIEMALNDKRAPQRQAVAGTLVNPTASLGTSTGTAPQLSQNEMARLLAEIQRQLYGCWHPPAGLADAKALVVTLDFSLNRDGSLASPPAVKSGGDGSPLFRTAAESAIRAVRECTSPPVGPLRLPAAKYEVWQELEISFDPRNMF